MSSAIPVPARIDTLVFARAPLNRILSAKGFRVRPGLRIRVVYNRGADTVPCPAPPKPKDIAHACKNW